VAPQAMFVERRLFVIDELVLSIVLHCLSVASQNVFLVFRCRPGFSTDNVDMGAGSDAENLVFAMSYGGFPVEIVGCFIGWLWCETLSASNRGCGDRCLSRRVVAGAGRAFREPCAASRRADPRPWRQGRIVQYLGAAIEGEGGSRICFRRSGSIFGYRRVACQASAYDNGAAR